MKTNIPIYRAKKINSDEYVEGYFYHEFYTFKPYIHDSVQYDEIDPSTLAIHFPDIIDSEGTKIFASLSEDGKGGSSVSFDGKDIGYIFFKDGKYQINDTEDNEISNLETYSDELKVTGVQQ